MSENKGEFREIPIASIRRDPRAQPRVQMSLTATDEYGDAMRDGATFPPVVVFQ